MGTLTFALGLQYRRNKRGQTRSVQFSSCPHVFTPANIPIMIRISAPAWKSAEPHKASVFCITKPASNANTNNTTRNVSKSDE